MSRSVSDADTTMNNSGGFTVLPKFHPGFIRRFLPCSDTTMGGSCGIPTRDAEGIGNSGNQSRCVRLTIRRFHKGRTATEEKPKCYRGKAKMFLHKSILIHEVRVQNPDPVFAEKL